MTADAPTRSPRAWLMAARPHTLPASVAPVLVGTGLAAGQGLFAPWPALAALLGALLIQIATNLANDVQDAERGADTPARRGFTRVTASGLIPAARVRAAMWTTFGAAALVGCLLVWVGGLPIVAVGVASILAGLGYTGGPWPYGYRALGDAFVFLFFGVVAVVGTYYVQACWHAGAALPLAPPPGTLPPLAWLASLAPAALATAILVVNNLRDRDTDRAAGKITLAVLLGPRGARAEYLALLALAYAVPPGLVAAADACAWALLPLASLPLAVAVARRVLAGRDGPALNAALAATGRLLLAHSALFAAGLAAPAL